MYKNNSILGVIPAKGRSRRLPKKNLKLFFGKPLVIWTILEAKKSKFLDRVVVSTDCKRISAIAKRYGASVPFMRPKRLCGDSVSATEVAAYVADRFRKKMQNFDAVILLQPTSPLRAATDIDRALKLFFKKKVDSLISVAKSDRRLAYAPNGAIYIIKSDKLLEKKTFNLKKIAYYAMDNEVSVDIDTASDFKKAKMVRRKNLRTERGAVKR
ncbi:MAG: acylneuraminate cytidylyltransferase family protein [Candidatus Omnitrophota bacterium]